MVFGVGTVIFVLLQLTKDWPFYQTDPAVVAYSVFIVGFRRAHEQMETG